MRAVIYNWSTPKTLKGELILRPAYLWFCAMVHQHLVGGSLPMSPTSKRVCKWFFLLSYNHEIWRNVPEGWWLNAIAHSGTMGPPSKRSLIQTQEECRWNSCQKKYIYIGKCTVSINYIPPHRPILFMTSHPKFMIFLSNPFEDFCIYSGPNLSCALFEAWTSKF
jgi:hypothetical protein